MRIHSHRFTAALLLIVTVAALAHADGDQVGEAVAIIEDYAGDPSQYRVIRRTETLDVKAFMELHVGDEVVLASEQGELTLVYYDGARIEVKPESASHGVVDSRSERTIVGNLLRWAGGLVGDLRAGDEEPQYESMMSRGVLEPEVLPLALPLLSADESILQAGRRDLHVGWIGGEPPYRLTLTRVSRSPRTVAGLEGLVEQRAVLPDLRLKKGVYEIVIVDGRDDSVRGRFEARKDPELPQIPAQARAGAGSRAYEATLSALFLAAWGDHEFAFESYQRLSPQAADYAPADAVRCSLEQGIRPTGASS